MHWLFIIAEETRKGCGGLRNGARGGGEDEVCGIGMEGEVGVALSEKLVQLSERCLGGH